MIVRVSGWVFEKTSLQGILGYLHGWGRIGGQGS